MAERTVLLDASAVWLEYRGSERGPLLTHSRVRLVPVWRNNFLLLAVVSLITLPSCGGGSDSPTSPTAAPNASPSAEIQVSPGSPYITGATELTLTAVATDPDGDALSYQWDFGDGATAAGQTTTHVYQVEGTFTIRLTVADSRGASGTASAQVASRTVTAVWHSGSRKWNYRLEQVPTVTAQEADSSAAVVLEGLVLGFKDVQYRFHPDLVISGTISPEGVVEFSAPAFRISFTGSANDADLNELYGESFDCARRTGCQTVGDTLIRQ